MIETWQNYYFTKKKYQIVLLLRILNIIVLFFFKKKPIAFYFQCCRFQIKLRVGSICPYLNVSTKSTSSAAYSGSSKWRSKPWWIRFPSNRQPCGTWLWHGTTDMVSAYFITVSDVGNDDVRQNSLASELSTSQAHLWKLVNPWLATLHGYAIPTSAALRTGQKLGLSGFMNLFLP